MKSTLRLLVALSLTSAATAADLTLGSGVVLKEARIVHITDKMVTIVHAGGTVSVPPADVDLEVLARAQMELEAKQADRAKRAAHAAAKADERKAIADEKKEEDVRIALAMSAARGNTHTDAPAAPAEPAPSTAPVAKKKAAAPAKAAPDRVDPVARIAQLKASFPPKSVGTARVFIPKSGQGGRSYILSSSATNLPDGRSITSESATTRSQGRVEPFTYDVPSAETWNWYRSMLQTTTLDALPRTLKMIDDRLVEDTQKAQAASGGSSMSMAAQGKHTVVWFDKILRPHLEQWRALLR